MNPYLVGLLLIGGNLGDSPISTRWSQLLLSRLRIAGAASKGNGPGRLLTWSAEAGISSLCCCCCCIRTSLSRSRTWSRDVPYEWGIGILVCLPTVESSIDRLKSIILSWITRSMKYHDAMILSKYDFPRYYDTISTKWQHVFWRNCAMVLQKKRTVIF